jgi:hypothetical protein
MNTVLNHQPESPTPWLHKPQNIFVALLIIGCILTIVGTRLPSADLDTIMNGGASVYQVAGPIVMMFGILMIAFAAIWYAMKDR